ncbi:MAG TPA: SDR family NAD(P)-dependent oxidoreductase [Thermoanaerobaculia bacterium]|nr:SDR family NAD(P)-dependent oxidoreductase [Thermoanaerobaculia bacterium]
MSRVFITGSTDGLGLAAARALLAGGHEVVLHARSRKRAEVLSDLAPRARGVAIGDLSSAADTRAVANQVNALGRMDAVIHNAGVYLESARGSTPEGHATTLAVNLLAPYLLTAWIQRPDRLVYVSSGMHRQGGGDERLDDIDWTRRRWNASQAYAESKLYLTAFALAVARRWPNVLSNAVDPGWVPTKMGGPGATDDLEEGHLTQTWLAASEDPAARVSGGYWHHRKREKPAAEAQDPDFREKLLEKLKELGSVLIC